MAKLPQIFRAKDLPKEADLISNPNKSYQDCINEALSAMNAIGLNVQNIQLGNTVRFSTHDKKKSDKSGWYSFDYDGSVLYGAFGCWRSLEKVSFTSRSYQELSAIDKHTINEKIRLRKNENDLQQRQQHEYVAGKSQEILLETSQGITHEYINSKQVNLYHNLKILDNTLFIPLFDFTGKIWNWQKIYKNNEGQFDKRYFKPSEDASGRKQGCFYPIDGKDDVVLLCEGYSTGATLHDQTGQTVICAMDAGNIIEVSKELRKNPRFTQSRIIVCADNDHNKKTLNKFKETGLEVIEAPNHEKSGYDFNDFYRDGGNVKDYIFPPQKKNWLKNAEGMITDLTPPSFIIDDIIPDFGLGMIHGQSGHGKTFAVMDIAYHVATNMDWHGKQVEGGQVVYLAGEGHHSLKYRLIGLKQKYGRKLNRLYVSQSGCNLNTQEGLSLAVASINDVHEATGESPKIIFVDTLHRFLDGDENSSRDAKTMIEACDNLRDIFKCAVVLVHHTGLSEGAQDRARGSSSWKGAMDFEYNIKKNNNKLIMSCKKMKDSEEHPPIIFDFNTVDLQGINHAKTGKAITTKIIELSASQEPPKTKDKAEENKVKEDTNTISAAWRECGQLDQNNKPYISYAKMKWYAETFLEYSQAQLKHLGSTEKNRFIGRLIEAKIIEKLPHQNEPCYFFIDPALSFSLIASKNMTDCDKSDDDCDFEIPF